MSECTMIAGLVASLRLKATPLARQIVADVCRAWVCGAICLCAASSAPAQLVSLNAAPPGQARFIVPYVAGSIGDRAVRALEPMALIAMGTETVIENRPGAAGLIGLESLTRALPADYTLGLLSTGTLLEALAHRPELLERFQLVSTLGTSGMVLVSTRDASIGDLLARLRNDARVSFGSAGPGSSSYLCFAQLLKAVGRKRPVQHIPYRGSGPLLADLLGGNIETACVDTGSAVSHVESGKLKALAVTLQHPEPRLPGIPTLASAGVSGVQPGTWYAIIAPKAMRPGTVERMVIGLKAVLISPQISLELRTILSEVVAPDEAGPGAAGQMLAQQLASLQPYAQEYARENPYAGPPSDRVLADSGARTVLAPVDASGNASGYTAPSPRPPPPAPPEGAQREPGKASAVGAVDIASARTCDGQCAMLIAEAKCKAIKGARENLVCLMQNGSARDDTPELCAQARDVSGCRTKKEKLAATQAAPPRKQRSYDSVCQRNMDKIDTVMLARNIIHAAATYDLFQRDIHWNSARLLEPCRGSDAEVARVYQIEMESYNKVNAYCAGAHARYECTQWGASGGVSDNGGNPFNNPAWYTVWKAEIEKALSNPDYSADLGPIRGSGAVNAVDAACAAALKEIDAQHTAAQRYVPAGSVVVRSEAAMWLAATGIARINALCPASERYKSERARLQGQFRDIKRACDAMASSGACVGRLPGRDPLPPRAGNQPPPLRYDSVPKEKCEGRNFVPCTKKACEAGDGSFSIGKSSCVSCVKESGDWTICPPGSGGVSTHQ